MKFLFSAVNFTDFSRVFSSIGKKNIFLNKSFFRGRDFFFCQFLMKFICIDINSIK